MTQLVKDRSDIPIQRLLAVTVSEESPRLQPMLQMLLQARRFATSFPCQLTPCESGVRQVLLITTLMS